MYEVVRFAVGGGDTLADAQKKLVAEVVRRFEKDFPDGEFFITLSRSSRDAEDDELVREEVADGLPMWVESLSEVSGDQCRWRDRHNVPCLELGEGKNFDPASGFALLYDASVLTPAVILPLGLFEADGEKIASLLDRFSPGEEVDLTAIVSPGLYLEVYH